MKKKVLTLILCLTMALSLEACGGNDPVETPSQEQDTAEEKNEDQPQETVSDKPETEHSADPDEKVELTPDTIDKYFGFEYVAVADDAITEFTFVPSDIHGPSIPCAYTDTTAPDLNQITTIGNPSYEDFLPYVTIGKYDESLLGYHNGHIKLDDNNLDYYKSYEVLPLIEDKNIPIANSSYGTQCALLGPSEVIDTANFGSKLLLYNASDDFVSAMDGTFVGFSGDISPLGFTIGEDITNESTIEDVVTKYPPSEGRFYNTSANCIVLTWNTASGTVVEITFSRSNNDDNHTASKVTMRSADMPEDIFEIVRL